VLSRVGGQRGGESIPMAAGGELTIGKAGDCHMVIAEDDYVSRRHAKLVHSDGMVFVEDLGSSNGTFLKVRRPVALEPGDEIVVGTCVLRFEEKVQQSNS
jgi:pSer/pThr/pTyr-binding forkhead associated (FHA) protein